MSLTTTEMLEKAMTPEGPKDGDIYFDPTRGEYQVYLHNRWHLMKYDQPGKLKKIKIEINEQGETVHYYKYYLTMPVECIKVDLVLDKEPACECGADKCNLPTHASYCPKYKKEV